MIISSVGCVVDLSSEPAWLMTPKQGVLLKLEDAVTEL